MGEVGGWVDESGVSAGGGQGCCGGYQDTGQAVKQVLMTSPAGGRGNVYTRCLDTTGSSLQPAAGRSLGWDRKLFLTYPSHPDPPYFCLTFSAFPSEPSSSLPPVPSVFKIL